MRVRKKHIRSLVERLLAHNGVKSAPVPVEDIAQALGIEVRHTPAEEHLSGFLVRAPGTGRAIMGINKNQHPNRRRFSIAHEIGHFLLHPGQDIYVDERSESGLTVNLRGEDASAGTNPEEIEANMFAAELLMPIALLKADLASTGTLDFLDDDSLERMLAGLAKKYGVSKQALTYRLANLAYVNQSA